MYQLRHGLFGVLALTISSPLFAADMPYKPPIPVPVVASGWTGFYAGGELGFKSVTDDWTTNCVDAGGAPLGTCGSPFSLIVLPGAPDSSASNKFSTANFRYGAYVGFMVPAVSPMGGWHRRRQWPVGAMQPSHQLSVVGTGLWSMRRCSDECASLNSDSTMPSASCRPHASLNRNSISRIASSSALVVVTSPYHYSQNSAYAEWSP